MSRSRRRLESFREAPKRRRPRPKALTQLERFMTWAYLVPGVFLLLAMPFFHYRSLHRESIHRDVDGWSRRLNLTEEERRKLLEVEFTYHGGGNPYTCKKPRSSHENAEHVRAMVSAVRPEVSESFRKMISRGQ